MCRRKEDELVLTAQVGGGDPQFFAVFCHRAPGELNVALGKKVDNFTVAQRLLGIFLLDDGSNDFLYAGVGTVSPSFPA